MTFKLSCLEKIEENDDVGNIFGPNLLKEAARICRQQRSSAFIAGFQACHYAYGFAKGLLT